MWESELSISKVFAVQHCPSQKNENKEFEDFFRIHMRHQITRDFKVLLS